MCSHKCTHDTDNSPAALDNSKWTRRNDANVGPAFTAQSGFVPVLPEDVDVSYFVHQFLPGRLFEHLVTESNRYADQYLRSHQPLPRHARAASWKPVTIPEMKKFLAIYFLSGIVRKSQVEQYWSTDSYSQTPGFGSIMSRDHFLAILQFLHFANNETAQAGDRLAMLRPLTDMLTGIFQDLYVPCQCVSIDEELILYKGRLLFKQYIPSKRSRFGVKVFALCDTTGYMWTASIYTGKPANPLPHTNELGATGAIVVHLMEELLGKGYHLYVDNWYTSLDLAQYLLVHQTGLCGTLRANRKGIPADLKSLNIPKSEFAFRRKDRLQLVKLHDKKIIYLLSTVYNADMVNTRERDRQGRHIRRLKVNHEYNSKMGGVDKNDAMITNFTAMRKTLKWNVKVGLHFVEEALQNAYIIRKQHGGKENHHAFIQKAVHTLLQDAAEATAPAPGAAAQDRLIGKHFLDKNPPSAKRVDAMRACVVCKSHGVRKESRYCCKTCQGHPSLCVVPCFELYHTKKAY